MTKVGTTPRGPMKRATTHGVFARHAPRCGCRIGRHFTQMRYQRHPAFTRKAEILAQPASHYLSGGDSSTREFEGFAFQPVVARRALQGRKRSLPSLAGRPDGVLHPAALRRLRTKHVGYPDRGA